MHVHVASGQRLQRICKVVNRRWNLCSLLKQLCFLLLLLVFYLTRREHCLTLQLHAREQAAEL